jgi:hypothetical protein
VRAPAALTGSAGFHTVRGMTHSLSLDQLKQAVQLKEQIAALESELAAILGGAAPASAPAPAQGAVVPRRRGRPPGKRAETGHIVPAQSAPSTPAVTAKKSGRGGARIMGPEARARIAAAQKARWAKYRATKGR